MTSKQRSSRLPSLDGLRGAAAFVVLVHHALLLVPGLAAPYYTDLQAPFGSWEWLLSHTPLNVLWDGQAAVYVFFVLSGMVLAMQVDKHRKFNWGAYYPQRLARLYLPVWGGVLFATATFYLVPRLGNPHSLWLQMRTEDVTVLAFVKDITLLLGTGGLASPLWSLRFEIMFSLALPLYMWASRAFRQGTVFKVLGCLAIITAGGYTGSSLLTYVPMFLLGTIIATERRRLDAFAGFIGRSRHGWTMTILVALVLMSSAGIAVGMGVPESIEGATSGLTTLGSGLLVIAATHCQTLARLLARPIFQWLGTISFSLYLIHEPIVIAFGFMLQDLPAVVPIIVSILVSFVLGWLFYRFVEKPCHSLAKKLGTRSDKVEHPPGGAEQRAQ